MIMNKLITNICISLLLLASVFSACTPDEYGLGNMPSEGSLKISVTQNTVKDNIIYMENQTPQILPFWNFGTGFSNKQKDTINIPFAGEHTIKFIALSQGGKVATERKIIVTNNDESYFYSPISWNLLSNNGKGETWVWATDIPTGKLFGVDSEWATSPGWWSPSIAEMNENGVLFDEMTFDLNGAANFTFVHKSADGSSVVKTEKGFFETYELTVGDMVFNQVKILNSNISYWDKSDAPNPNVYDIFKLTEDELGLRRRGSGFSHVWFFKRKGYSY